MVQQCPGGAGVLVGQRHGGDLGRLAGDDVGKPWIGRTASLGVADDGHGAGDKQPTQIVITLLGDPSHALLAAGRVLSRHQPNPGSHLAA